MLYHSALLLLVGSVHQSYNETVTGDAIRGYPAIRLMQMLYMTLAHKYVTTRKANLKGGTEFMNEPVQVGIIGDFNPQLRYHLVTNEALRQAGRSLSMEVNCVWLPTAALEKAHSEDSLELYDALWCAPGSPYTSMEGALKGIQFAREKDRPFVGT
jgi:CTP synthase (UTP-ammonia lyase)